MSQSSITLAFGDGDYLFRLGLAQIEELQRKSGSGIGAICARLLRGRYQIGGAGVGALNEADFQISDIIEPIRQGLIGGGQGMVDGEAVTVNSLRANQMIEAYVLARPLSEAWSMSVAIIGALMEGYTPPKKAEPAAAPVPKPTRKRRTDASTMPAPSSTAP